MYGFFSGRNAVRISILVGSGLLIIVAVLFRHGLTLATGNSMRFVAGSVVVFWIVVALALILAISSASGVWRR